MKPIVFLGGGRITNALIAGLRLAKYKRPIVVQDRHPEKLSQLRKCYDVTTEADLKRAVAGAGLLIVAVRPDSVSELLQGIGKLDRPLLAISLAAGVPLSTLRKRLGAPVRWARAMPSPVCRTGRALIGLAFPRHLPAHDRRRLTEFFKHVGSVIEVPESQFDLFTATYSPSHGYHSLAALANAAESLGLDRKIAFAAAAHALADAVLSWREAEIPVRELIKEAATPGGIAAAVMSTMDKGGYLKLVENSLRSGVAQARANAKNLA